MNEVSSNMSEFALRAHLKDSRMGLLFALKLFHNIDARLEKEERSRSLLGGCTYGLRLSL